MEGLTGQARALLDLAQRAATAYGRADLVERLAAMRPRVDDPRARVLVVGEFKHGKSSLINALLGFEVCPIDDDIATSAPTVVQWAPELCAHAVLRGAGGEPPRREAIAIEQLPGWITEEGNPANERDVAMVEVGLPATLLQEGLALVDTPGVGGLGSVHSALTMATLPLADAVVFASDAAQEMTEPELRFLESVVALCPNVLAVTTKIDLHPEWRKIHELDGMHLEEAGLTVDRIALSSFLRELAIADGDKATNEESGFPALVRWLRSQVTLADERRTAAAVAATVGDVAAQLRRRFEAEREVLVDPDGAAALVAELERARDHAERVRAAGGRWQQVLNDGFADATAAIDVDLRSRLRGLLADGERMIDDLDPAVAWGEFERWLYREVASSVSEHLALRHGRLLDVAEAVAGSFGGDAAPPDLLVRESAPDLSRAEGRASFEVKRMALGAQALSLLRSSYGGITMFGALGGLAGIVVAVPAVVGVGLLLGGKGLREEKQRQLAQRRAQAKVSLRHYVDEVTFALTNDQRDTLRSMQRALRDHYAARASELSSSAKAAHDAAAAASGADRAQREARLAFIDAELPKIAVVAQRADALALAATSEPEVDAAADVEVA